MPLVYEENVAVAFVTTIADMTAPTTTEIDAGDQLAAYIRKDGVTFPSTRTNVPTASIDTAFDSEYPGSKGGQVSITFKRKDKDSNEAAWTLFKAGLVAGYLVVGFEGSNNTASDVVDVYQVTSHYPIRSNPAPNTEQTFVVNFPVQAEEIGVSVVSGI